jgi:hypothetical protein
VHSPRGSGSIARERTAKSVQSVDALPGAGVSLRFPFPAVPAQTRRPLRPLISPAPRSGRARPPAPVKQHRPPRRRRRRPLQIELLAAILAQRAPARRRRPDGNSLSPNASHSSATRSPVRSGRDRAETTCSIAANNSLGPSTTTTGGSDPQPKLAANSRASAACSADGRLIAFTCTTSARPNPRGQGCAAIPPS